MILVNLFQELPNLYDLVLQAGLVTLDSILTFSNLQHLYPKDELNR